MISHKPTSLQHQPAVNPGCPHYWVIEPHKGPASRGVCRLCGAKGQFTNYLSRHSAISDPARPAK